jgi:hypothetical protein
MKFYIILLVFLLASCHTGDSSIQNEIIEAREDVNISKEILHEEYQDIAWAGGGQMRLKIINHTNEEIKIYLNNLQTSILINPNTTYDSEVVLMDFANIYPFFIGIERIGGIIRYYAFKRPVSSSVRQFFYYVDIDTQDDSNNDGLANTNILSEESYLKFINQGTPRRSTYMGGADGWSSFNTIDLNSPPNNLEILILNDTNKKQNIIYRDHEKEICFELDIGNARLFRIFNPIFLQGNRHTNIEFLYYSIEVENCIIYPPRIAIRMEDGIKIVRLVDYPEYGIIVLVF